MLIPHICRRSGRIFSADFSADFAKSICEGACLTGVALAAATGEAQKPTRSSPPQNLHHFLFLCHSQSHSHCSTVMRMTRSQRTCYPPQRKRATSATQGQGRTTYRTPFSSSSRSQQVRVFPKPRQRSSLRPHPGPPSTCKADIPTSRNCSGKPAPTQQSFL